MWAKPRIALEAGALPSWFAVKVWTHWLWGLVARLGVAPPRWFASWEAAGCLKKVWQMQVVRLRPVRSAKGRACRFAAWVAARSVRAGVVLAGAVELRWFEIQAAVRLAQA